MSLAGEIILVQDRQDNYHLVDYCAPSGRKYTLCDVIYNKKSIINTLAMDNSITDICQKCQDYYNDVYGDENALFPIRISRGGLLEKQQEIYEDAQEKSNKYTCGLAYKYSYLSKKDSWQKMSTYKRKLRIDVRK
jgi:hypothetical protein